MFRNILTGLLGAMFVLALTGTAKADLFVNDNGLFVDLGSYDNLVASITTNGFETLVGTGTDPKDELKWINYALKLNGSNAYTIDDYTKINKPGATWNDMWKPVYSSVAPLLLDNPLGYAFELTDRPDYFMIKLGGPKANVNYLLFENNSNFDWAAIQLTGLGYTIENIGKISHIDQIGSNPVPEPATLMLFGSGILGLAGIARRKKR